MRRACKPAVVYLTIAVLTFGQSAALAAPVNVSAANIRVVQNWLQYNPADPIHPNQWGDKTSATVTVPQSTGDWSMPDWNTGDFYPAVGGQYLNLNNGILLATVRNNGRDNGDGAGVRYATVETTSLNTPWGGSAFLATNPAGNDNLYGDELNIDLAAAWFVFSAGWTGANVNGATINSSSADVSTSNLTKPSTGTWNLTLPGVDARRDGLVFANGGGNSNNFAAAGASADGSRFDLQLRDNYSSNLEDGPIAFLYVPYDTENMVLGRVSGLGGLYNKSGDFTVRREGVGTFRLSIPGHDPTTGMLLLTSDALSIANDNILSYEADGSDFIIQSRDVNNAAPVALQDIGGAAAFQFAFIPFATPPSAPGGRSFNAAGQVAAANLRVTEYGSGDAGENLHAEVTQGAGYLTTPTWTKGDYAVYQNGVPLDATAGVLLATVRQNGRLNPTTAADTRYTIAPTYDVGGAYWIGTYWAGYPTWPGEFNVDVATAYFPFAAGWQGGRAFNPDNNLEMNNLIASPGITLGTEFIDVAGGGGEYHLFLKKNGGADPVDARRDGLVFATGNKDENNFGAAGPSADGSRFVLRVHDSDGSGGENDPVAFVYVPFDTPGVVSGRVTGYAGLLNGSGEFTVRRESAGAFRLTIPGESPSTGMLLLNSDAVTSTAGRLISYEADGTDFIIQQRSFSSNAVPALWDAGNAAAFSFAFIPFDDPPTAPGVRNFATGSQVAAANVRVTEYGSGDPAVNLHVEVAEGTGYLTTPTWTKGDYAVYQNGVPLSGAQGVLISSIARNGQDIGGGVIKYATASVVRDAAGNYSLSTHEAGTPYTGTDINVNTAVAYFPFAGGWQAGHAYYTTAGANGVPIEALSATPGINLGTEFIDNNNGLFYVRLPGVNALTDGLLLANHGKDEGNYAMTRPDTGGSQFVIHVHDNGANGGGTEQDPVAFAYVPFGTPNLVMGRLNGMGAPLASQGEFSIRKSTTQAGTFELRIPGQTPATGALLITGSAQGASNDNIVTYEAAGDHWVIQTRDLPDMTLQNLALSEGLADFVFIPFANPPAAPGARPTYDPNRVAAANYRVTEFNANNGTDNGDMYAQVTEGSAGLGVWSNNLGDIILARAGAALTDAHGVLLATIREHERDNSATGGRSGYGMAATSLGYVRTHWAPNAGWAEQNIDFAVALFPAGAGFSTGQNVPTSGTSSIVTVPGAGDTRYSGVLLANVYANEDDLVTVQPTAAGDGWHVRTLDKNGSTLSNQPISYAFLPYGTENLVAGQIIETGYVLNKQGNFTLTREGTGLYRLRIPGESPKTGMLLLTATQGGVSADNMLVYVADGDDFLIRGLDAGSSPSASMPQDTYFNFAFIGFDNPPANPQLRAVDPRTVIAGKIQVFDAGSPKATVTQSTGGYGLTVPAGNLGDYDLALDGRALMQEDGVVMATPRQHMRNGSRGVVSVPGSLTHGAGNSTNGGMWIAVHNGQGAAPEHDIDVAAAWFAFGGGWTGGHVSQTGTLLAGNRVDQSMLTKLGPGRFDLRIPGVDSLAGGILLAVPGGNEDDNVIAAAPFADGSGWNIVMRDNDGDFANSEGDGNYDAWSFVHVPYDSIGLVAAGRIDDDGSVLNAAGSASFSVNRSAPGQYSLVIDGFTPDDGILLLTESKMGYTEAAGYRAEDNWLTYEDDGLGAFSIQSYDLPNEDLQDSEFVFLFLPTAGGHAMMSVPEPASLTLLVMGLLALGWCWRRRRGPAARVTTG